jgi:hypothetical protein
MSSKANWRLTSYYRRHRYYVRVKLQAQADGTPFDLTLNELASVAREPCARCGNEKVVEIEMLDATVGWERENLRTVCRLCQRLVGELGSVGLLDYAQRVARNGVT